MKIAFWGINLQNKYSGGRLHAFIMAMTLAYQGNDVDYYTNTIPVFNNMFDSYLPKKHFNWKIKKSFLFYPKETYDIIFVAPHLASRKSFFFDRFIFYPMVKRLKRVSKSKLIFLDFESPNWIQDVGDYSRPISKYKYSNKIIPDVDVILSTTKTGMNYARKYYSTINDSLIYKQLYLAINSFVADKVGFLPKRNIVTFFGRFKEKHKGGDKLITLMKSVPAGYELIIIGEKNNLSDEVYTDMMKISRDRNVTVNFRSKVTEKEKFTILSSSKLLIFVSNFEGYGIPPVEAQYVGTPVLCSNLSVLKEINRYAFFSDFTSDKLVKKEIFAVLNAKKDPAELHKSVKYFANFKNYSDKLDIIIKEILEL